MSDAGAPISPEQRESASGASAVPLHEGTESTGVQPDSKLLEDIAQRVLWLSTRIVDAANHDRATGDGVKVGGHQASSASGSSTTSEPSQVRTGNRLSSQPARKEWNSDRPAASHELTAPMPAG